MDNKADILGFTSVHFLFLAKYHFLFHSNFLINSGFISLQDLMAIVISFVGFADLSVLPLGEESDLNSHINDAWHEPLVNFILVFLS